MKEEIQEILACKNVNGKRGYVLNPLKTKQSVLYKDSARTAL
jgi:hypothetical protein